MMPIYLANLHSQYKSHPFILVPIWLDVPSHMLIIASHSKGRSERAPENNFWILAGKTTTQPEQLLVQKRSFSSGRKRVSTVPLYLAEAFSEWEAIVKVAIVILMTFTAGVLEENACAHKILIQEDKGNNPRPIINAICPHSLAIYHVHTNGPATCCVSMHYNGT